MNTRSRLALGLSGFADNAIGTAIGVHLFMFYTDIVGMTPMWVSLGLTCAIFADAIFGIYMGAISDRTRSKYGRRRPYVLLASVPVGGGFWLLMDPPSWTDGALAGYFATVLLCLFLARTMGQIPALALISETAENDQERLQMTSTREQLGNIGDLVGLLVPIALVLLSGASEEDAPERLAKEAFAWSGILLGGLVCAALIAVYRGTSEHPRHSSLSATNSTGVDWSAARTLLRQNESLRSLLVAGGLTSLALAFMQTLILYVFEHVMMERDPAVHLGAFVVNVLGAIASYPFWTRHAAKVGPPAAFRTGLVLTALVFPTVFLVGPGNTLGLAIIMAFSGAANVGFWMLLSTLTASVAEADKERTGLAREGLVAALGLFVRKLSAGGAALGVGVGLTLIGYEEHLTQSTAVVLRLQLLFALPTTLLVIGSLWSFRHFATQAASVRNEGHQLLRVSRADEDASTAVDQLVG